MQYKFRSYTNVKLGVENKWIFPIWASTGKVIYQKVQFLSILFVLACYSLLSLEPQRCVFLILWRSLSRLVAFLCHAIFSWKKKTAFDFLSFVKIWFFELHHNLGFWVSSQFEFHHCLSSWVCLYIFLVKQKKIM